MTKCCVIGCKNVGTHKFPTNPSMRRKWIAAVRIKHFVPTTSTRLCREHFTENDYRPLCVTTGLPCAHKFLNKDAVPSIFSWSKKPVTDRTCARGERITKRDIQKNIFSHATLINYQASTSQPSTSQGLQHEQEYQADIEIYNSTISCSSTETQERKTTIGTQTDATRDSITSLGISVVSEDKLVAREDPQTTIDAHIEVTEETPRHDKEETIEQYKCYTIIANVYHYLKKEYRSMKSHTGGSCDLSPLAGILKRTADATGVSQPTVTAALETEKLKTSIRSDHSYNLRNKRLNSAHCKSKKAGSSSNMPKKGRKRNYKRRANNKQDDGSVEGLRPPKRKRATKSLKKKLPSIKQLPQNDGRDAGRLKSFQRQGICNNPTDEEYEPFSSETRLGLPEGIETEYKADPDDDNCHQMLENDPLGPVSPLPTYCSTLEGTPSEFKPEPADEEWPPKLTLDPLHSQLSHAATGEPSDTSDVEVKTERVDDESDLCTDYFICDPALVDIKPELPSE